ncbi:MAG: preprotein translocase subunit SecY [Clostridia bacterium]|nr:preprotein translocase subunit SecY [Clostridia bacterium]
MLKTFKNAWKIPDLRKKILFTIFIVVLYRLGANIFVPYIDSHVMEGVFNNADVAGSMFQYLNILSGSALSQATLFALSISPYITASIVIQLLSVAIPALERLSKEGEEGKKILTQWTRIITVVLGLITATGYYLTMRNGFGQGAEILTDKGVFAAIVIIVCYVAGTALVMWLAELINEHGIGNGISIILFANILAGSQTIVQTIIGYITKGPWWLVVAEIVIFVSLAIVTFVVFITESERRLPVQYAKKVVGRKMYGGQSTHLPIKLNMSGVMPIIFANSIVALPSTIALIFPANDTTSWWYHVVNFFSPNGWFYPIAFAVLIVAFAYFYISISFNPVEVSNNLKKNGGFIPGIRPGRPTSDYITKVLNRIVLMGAFFLCIIAIIPMIANWVSGGALQGIAFGGSSLLIVVGVVLETAREIEGQMTMRHYKGFLE